MFGQSEQTGPGGGTGAGGFGVGPGIALAAPVTQSLPGESCPTL